MKDHWMNVGHEEEELKPYIEPEADFSDSSRIGMSEWFCTEAARSSGRHLPTAESVTCASSTPPVRAHGDDGLPQR